MMGSVGTFHSQLSETVSSWFDVLANCGPCDQIGRHRSSAAGRSPWTEKLPAPCRPGSEEHEHGTLPALTHQARFVFGGSDQGRVHNSQVAGVCAHLACNPSECTTTSASPRVIVSPLRASDVYGYFRPSALNSDYLAFGDQDLAPADAKPATGGAPGASCGGDSGNRGGRAEKRQMSDFDVILEKDAVERKVGHSPRPCPTVASNTPMTQDLLNLHTPLAPESSPQATPQTTPQMKPNATPKALQPIREHSTSERPTCLPCGEQIPTRLARAPPSERKFSPTRSEALAGEGYADVAISPGRPAQAGESELQRIFQERQQRAARKRDSFLACEKEREERERTKVKEEREHERTREREERGKREQEQASELVQRERKLRQAVSMRAAIAVSPRHHEEEGVQAETEDSGGRLLEEQKLEIAAMQKPSPQKQQQADIGGDLTYIEHQREEGEDAQNGQQTDEGGRQAELEFTMEGADEDWEHSSDSEAENNELGAC